MLKVRSGFASALVLSILLLSAFAFVPVRPASASTQTVDVTGYVNCGASGRTCTVLWQTYDSAHNINWLSIDPCSDGCYGAVYSVDLTNVLTFPATSITSHINILNTTLSAGGSLAGITAGTMLNGYLWALGYYSTGKVVVGQITSPAGSLVNQYFYGSGYADALSIANDGSSLFFCAQNSIVKMTTSGAFSPVHTTSGDCYDLTIQGGVIYFAESGSAVAGQVNVDGTSFSEYSPAGGFSGGTFACYVSGSLYVTDRIDHKLLKFTSGNLVKSNYALGMTLDGPIGCHYNTATGNLVVDGYANISVCPVSVSTDVVGACTSTSKKPFQSIVDSSNNDWVIAKGSTDMIKFDGGLTSAASTTSTTTTSTSSSSSTTTTTTSASSSSSTTTTTTSTTTAIPSLATSASQYSPHILFTSGNLYVATRTGNFTVSGAVWFFAGKNAGGFGNLTVRDPPFVESVFGDPVTQYWCSIISYLPWCKTISPPSMPVDPSSSRTGFLCSTETLHPYIVSDGHACSSGGFAIWYETFSVTVPIAGQPDCVTQNPCPFEFRAFGTVSPPSGLPYDADTVFVYIWA